MEVAGCRPLVSAILARQAKSLFPGISLEPAFEQHDERGGFGMGFLLISAMSAAGHRGAAKPMLVLAGLFGALMFAGVETPQAAMPPTPTSVARAAPMPTPACRHPRLQPCSIGRAMSSVVAGDLVIVAPGRYFEAPALRRSGTSVAPIVFSAAGAPSSMPVNNHRPHP